MINTKFSTVVPGKVEGKEGAIGEGTQQTANLLVDSLSQVG